MEVYAELFHDEKKNDFLNYLPSGAVLRRKGKSRACLFECDDELVKQSLVELLENSQVCYQDMDEKEDDDKEDEDKENSAASRSKQRSH